MNHGAEAASLRDPDSGAVALAHDALPAEVQRQAVGVFRRDQDEPVERSRRGIDRRGGRAQEQQPAEVDRHRLYASLAVGIAVSTVNNFTWNRLWTWSDRQHATAVEEGQRLRKRSLLAQLGQYAAASWVGIGLQYVLALWLAHFLPYLLATVIAIVIASVSNFIANDRWTFRHKRK